MALFVKAAGSSPRGDKSTIRAVSAWSGGLLGFDHVNARVLTCWAAIDDAVGALRARP